MTTIVMNLLNGAVTEYDWTFQSITPLRAGDSAGLYTLGGDLDHTSNIDGEIRTGKTLLNSSMKKGVEDVYFSMRSEGYGRLRVEGEAGVWLYPFQVRASGVSRQAPGKGICENYVSVGYSNVDGVDFQLDRIDVEVVQSKQRRL